MVLLTEGMDMLKQHRNLEKQLIGTILHTLKQFVMMKRSWIFQCMLYLLLNSQLSCLMMHQLLLVTQ